MNERLRPTYYTSRFGFWRENQRNAQQIREHEANKKRLRQVLHIPEPEQASSAAEDAISHFFPNRPELRKALPVVQHPEKIPRTAEDVLTPTKITVVSARNEPEISAPPDRLRSLVDGMYELVSHARDLEQIVKQLEDAQAKGLVLPTGFAHCKRSVQDARMNAAFGLSVLLREMPELSFQPEDEFRTPQENEDTADE